MSADPYANRNEPEDPVRDLDTAMEAGRQSGLPPIHLTGEHADRMTPAEREATIARIREQQPSLQPRCKVCGEGMQFLGIRNMICPRASEHPEPSPSERVKAHRSKREAMYGPTRNKDADAEPYVEQPETTPERMCTSGAVSGPKETIPDTHRTERDDHDDVASFATGISPNGTVQDLAPQEPTPEDSYPPESALPVSREQIARYEMRIMSVKSDILSDREWRDLIDSHEHLRAEVERMRPVMEATDGVPLHRFPRGARGPLNDYRKEADRGQ